MERSTMLLMGKSPLFLNGPFSIANCWHNQRVHPINIPLNHFKIPLNHYKIPLNHYKIPLNHYKIPLKKDLKIQFQIHFRSSKMSGGSPDLPRRGDGLRGRGTLWRGGEGFSSAVAAIWMGSGRGVFMWFLLGTLWWTNIAMENHHF